MVVLGDSPNVVLLGEEGHRRALGLPIALNQCAGELGHRLLDDPRRHGPTAILDVAQTRDVVVVEARDRHHPIEHRGNT